MENQHVFHDFHGQSHILNGHSPYKNVSLPEGNPIKSHRKPSFSYGFSMVSYGFRNGHVPPWGLQADEPPVEGSKAAPLLKSVDEVRRSNDGHVGLIRDMMSNPLV